MFDTPLGETVAALEARGVLRVEDGNHGNDRPRPQEFGCGNIAFIRAADLEGGRVLFDSADKINNIALARIRKGKGRAGDILFSSKGTVGKLAIVPMNAPPFVCSPQTTFWRTLDENQLNRSFLYAYMQSSAFARQWQAIKGDTDMADYASLTSQREFRVPLPHIHFQREIASVFQPLINKIDLNRRMNRTLEELASGLFRSWFIDFDPVVAKAAGRKPTHLRADLAELFPAHFQDSLLGPLPRGWRARPVTDLVDLNPNRHLQRGTPAPYLDMQSMPTDSALPEEWVIRPYGSGMKFQNGDTLLARITPCLENGKTAFVNALGDGEIAWGSTEYIVMRSKPPLPLEYSYFLARSDEFRSHAIANMVGSSGRQRVATSNFEHFLVAEPSEKVAEAFGEMVAPFVRQMKANVDHSKTLVALRDTLLPKLLSGELRVKQAEKLVAAEN